MKYWLGFLFLLLILGFIMIPPRASVRAANGLIDHIEYGEVDSGSDYGPTHYDRYHDRATGDDIICFSGYRRLSCFPTGRNWK